MPSDRPTLGRQAGLLLQDLSTGVPRTVWVATWCYSAQIPSTKAGSPGIKISGLGGSQHLGFRFGGRRYNKMSENSGRRLIAKFYRAPDGAEPVNEFIEGQRATVRLAIDRQIDRINLLDEDHPHLAFPHSSQIEGELRELRCHYGAVLYRILYRRSEQFVVLLHIFEKRTKAVPEADKQIARERWADFRKRMDARPRGRPSPIGKKAPPKKRA